MVAALDRFRHGLSWLVPRDGSGDVWVVSLVLNEHRANGLVQCGSATYDFSGARSDFGRNFDQNLENRLCEDNTYRSSIEMITILLVVLLIFLLVGGLPTWGYSSGWGYGPSGLVGVILVVLLIFLLLGHRF